MARPITILTFLLTLALTVPAAFFVPSVAQALPGSTLSDAGENGKRTHKRAGKKNKKASNKKKTRKRTTHRTTTSRPAQGSTRVERRTGRTTRSGSRHTTRRTTRTQRRHVRERRHVHRRPARATRTTVTHHGPRRAHRQQSHTSTRRSHATGSRRSSIDAYITGGLGISGLASDTITDTALPGLGYNVAVGFKGSWLGAEFGFNGGGYTFDPEAASTDLATMGLSADLKLQPSFGIVEPFAAVGVGAYMLNDGILDARSNGAALRLGLGLDLRFDDVSLGARYLHSSYGFGDESGLYGGAWTASTETVGLNLGFYF